MESPAVTQSTDHKRVSRLYPSLPSTNRFEVCLPLGFAGEKLHTKKSESPPRYLPADTQSEEPISTYERTKAEIFVLEEQNKELLAINKKWAKEYRTMEQFYREKVKLSKVSRHNNPSDEEKSDKEERRVVFFEGEENVKTDRQTREDGADELRAQNRALARRGRHQQEEIRRLNKALEEALLASRQRERSGESSQDVWKHQAELYKEDFKKERADREKLKGKYLDLEKRCQKLHRELNVLKSQVTLPRPAHCCSCTNRVKYSNWEVNQPHT
ncbi:TNFAIP3-interacting protein 3 [Austrofundulus limnaeus]|uniref:TNFAIP3-interacting protein 3 n=1 Tax=Austrofundulus limnaeus TaxID=52670 RepID=A0A2I4AZ99_AUSLI|nr:PREDICTED: TNFAIP3-interacting protein 3-like [Austrofundulus limnaeus]